MEMSRVKKDFVSAEEARATLIRYLNTYHSDYSIDDIVLSDVRGYLKCLKPCTCNYPPFDGSVLFFPRGAEEPHYHTISIEGIASKDKRYRYQLWDALKRFEVLREKKRRKGTDGEG